MQKHMVRWFGVGVLLLLGTLTHADTLWKPQPAPAHLSGALQTLLLAVDSSGSMGGSQGQPPKASRARAAATNAINSAPTGTYVIVAAFGTQARVLLDRFLLTHDDRQALQNALGRISMRDAKTDVAGLEELVGQIHAALLAAFGSRGFRLDVQVFTDGRPVPVNPSDTRTFDVLLGQRTTRRPLAGGHGLFAYTASFMHAPEPEPQASNRLDTDTTSSEIGHSPVADAPAPTPGEDTSVPSFLDAGALEPPGGTKAGAQGHVTKPLLEQWAIRLGLPVGGPAIVTCLLFGFVVLKRRSRQAAQAILEQAVGNQDDTGDARPRSQAALVLSEYATGPDGERHCLQEPRPVAYIPGVPLGIGPNPRHCHYVLLTPGVPDRLLGLTVNGGGVITITPEARVTELRIDGQPVTHPLSVTAEAPHVITAGNVELRLELTEILVDPDTDREFFRRLREPASATYEPNNATPPLRIEREA